MNPTTGKKKKKNRWMDRNVNNFSIPAVIMPLLFLFRPACCIFYRIRYIQNIQNYLPYKFLWQAIGGKK